MKKLAISAFAVPAGKGGIRKWLLGGIACFEMRLTALLSMRKVLDDIEKFLILRKLRSSYLEGRNALIQPIVVFLTPSKSRIHASAASNFSSDCRALPEVTGSCGGSNRARRLEMVNRVGAHYEPASN